MNKISLVVAMAENRVIGRENRLPWHLPQDLKHFKSITTGHPVIMGRKTFESIGRALPNRINIVITRKGDWSADGVIVCHDVEEALRLANREAEAIGVGELMVIGGANLYDQLLPRAYRLYLTLVHAEVEGDALFPDFNRQQWNEVSRVEHSYDTGNPYNYSFIVLDRKNPG